MHVYIHSFHWYMDILLIKKKYERILPYIYMEIHYLACHVSTYTILLIGYMDIIYSLYLSQGISTPSILLYTSKMPVCCTRIYNLLSGYMDDLRFGDLCNGRVICSNMSWNRISYHLNMNCGNSYTNLF
jgi:hypothetical protein